MARANVGDMVFFRAWRNGMYREVHARYEGRGYARPQGSNYATYTYNDFTKIIRRPKKDG